MNVNVYGVTYEIIELKGDKFYNNLFEIEHDKNEVDLGRCLNVAQAILINESLEEDTKRLTLMHELAHAIIFVLGYGKMNEETIAQFVAAHHDFIDNVVTDWKEYNDNSR